MSSESDRPRVLRAIKKCLSDAYEHCQEAMDALDEIGRGSIGTGMTPLIGGFAMSDPNDNYRTALIEVDRVEKSLKPLIKRYEDERINESHFKDEQVMKILQDIAQFEYQIILDKLSKRQGRETAWYRLRELSDKIEKVFRLVAEE
ncbi:hypothetical protein EU537_13030 [Candidatus Thorarchaeota archaeon]|nr:MAG: hypothetical protein EU537_13030 [Candidatus Thorarchaeota archaeon]